MTAKPVTRALAIPVQPLALASLVLVAMAMLAGCNTVEGVGQDVDSGGRAIERAAD